MRSFLFCVEQSNREQTNKEQAIMKFKNFSYSLFYFLISIFRIPCSISNIHFFSLSFIIPCFSVLYSIFKCDTQRYLYVALKSHFRGRSGIRPPEDAPSSMPSFLSTDVPASCCRPSCARAGRESRNYITNSYIGLVFYNIFH